MTSNEVRIQRKGEIKMTEKICEYCGMTDKWHKLKEIDKSAIANFCNFNYSDCKKFKEKKVQSQETADNGKLIRAVPLQPLAELGLSPDTKTPQEQKLYCRGCKTWYYRDYPCDCEYKTPQTKPINDGVKFSFDEDKDGENTLSDKIGIKPNWLNCDYLYVEDVKLFIQKIKERIKKYDFTPMYENALFLEIDNLAGERLL